MSKMQWFGIAAGVLIVLIIALLYREAKNEIHALCGNFVEGMPKVIAEEQLATVQFSRVREVHARQIIMDSPYNLYIHRCVIDFSFNKKVETARIENF